jgi:hypothetical protein
MLTILGPSNTCLRERALLILLSLNCRGLANPSMKLALKRFVEVHKLPIIFLQETMMTHNKAINYLASSLPRWDILATVIKDDHGDS